MVNRPCIYKILKKKTVRALTFYACLNFKWQQIVHLAFIRPVFEYGDIAWDNCFDQSCNLLEDSKLKLNELVQGWDVKLFKLKIVLRTGLVATEWTS